MIKKTINKLLGGIMMSVMLLNSASPYYVNADGEEYISGGESVSEDIPLDIPVSECIVLEKYEDDTIEDVDANETEYTPEYSIYGNGTDGIYIDIDKDPYRKFSKYPHGENAYKNTGCAWFASARVNDITEKGSVIWSGPSWWENAESYGFARGSGTPTGKAIACYRGANGGNPHVAIVEKVNGDIYTMSEGGISLIINSQVVTAPHGYCAIHKVTKYAVEHQKDKEFIGYVYLTGGSEEQLPMVSLVIEDRIYSGTFKFWAQRKDDDPGHHAQFFIDGQAVTQFLQADSNGYFSFNLDTSKYEDGEHELSVEYCNTKSSWVDKATIRILNRGIEICDYKDGDVFSGKARIYAKRFESDPEHYLNFYVDDVLEKELIKADSNNYFTIEFDTNKYSDGEHTISVKYANSLYAYTDAIKIQIINQGIKIADYKDGDSLSGTVKIYAKRFDNDPEHYLNYYIDDEPVKELLKADVNGYFVLELDTTKYQDGNHKISVKYANSRYVYTEVINIKIVNTGILICDYKNGDIISGTIKIYAKRFESDPEHYLNFYIDDELVQELVKADVNDYFLLEVDTSQYSDGEHTFSVKYANSKYSYTDVRSLKIINKGIEIADYKNGDKVSGNVLFCAKRFDDDPEHYLDFYIDDVPVAQLIKADSNGAFYVEIDTSQYENGEHKIRTYYANSKYAYSDERIIIFENSETVIPISVSLNKISTTIEVGDIEVLTAAITPDNTTDKTVIWKSSDETIATVNNDGVVTARKVGSATITAQTKVGGLTASCIVIVKSTDISIPVISDIRIINLTPNGYTVVCKATDDNKIERVCFPTWTEYNEEDDLIDNWFENAKATSVSENEYSFDVSIADHNDEKGRYRTHIYAYDEEGNYAKAGVDDIIVPTYVSSIELSEKELTLAIGETKTITAKVLPEEATNKKITWTSSNDRIVTVKDGHITAIETGEATITVKAVDEGEVCARCSIIVKGNTKPIPGPSDNTIAKQNPLSVSPEITDDTKEIYLVKGQKFTLSENGWSSSDKKTLSISKKNLLTAKKETSTPIKLIKGDRNIDVYITKPTMAAKSFTVQVGSCQAISFNYDDEHLEVQWYSNAPDIATVSDEGKVTAIAKGTATITAYVNGTAYTCKVKVLEDVPAVDRTLHLTVDGKKTIRIKGIKKVTWISDDDKIVSVTKKNKIKAEAIGETVLRTEYDGREYRIHVYVENPTITTKEIQSVGKNKYKLTLSPNGSSKIEFVSINQSVIFKSSKGETAYVDADGIIHANRPGKAKLTTKINGKTITITVTVQ